MEVASCTGWYWVPMEQTCGLHGRGFPTDRIILSVEEQSNFRDFQKQIRSRVWKDDTIGVMELHILKAELGSEAEGVGIVILTRTETKEEGNDE